MEEIEKPLDYPEGVAAFLGISVWTLRAMRARGDCPPLYRVTDRTFKTTRADVLEWLKSRQVPNGFKQREPVKTSGKVAKQVHRSRAQLLSIDGGARDGE